MNNIYSSKRQKDMQKKTETKLRIEIYPLKLNSKFNYYSFDFIWGSGDTWKPQGFENQPCIKLRNIYDLILEFVNNTELREITIKTQCTEFKEFVKSMKIHRVNEGVLLNVVS
jgi:hypothetical protein